MIMIILKRLVHHYKSLVPPVNLVPVHWQIFMWSTTSLIISPRSQGEQGSQVAMHKDHMVAPHTIKTTTTTITTSTTRCLAAACFTMVMDLHLLHPVACWGKLWRRTWRCRPNVVLQRLLGQHQKQQQRRWGPQVLMCLCLKGQV